MRNNSPPARPRLEGDTHALHTLLLRAAFGSGDVAVRAWDAWHTQINWDEHVDGASFRLLPQLARNLAAHAVQHPLLAKFHGSARKAWYENQILFHALAPFAQSVQAAGGELLVLYGAALTVCYYPDTPLGEESDIGLLVRGIALGQTLPLLRAAGCSPALNVPEKILTRNLAARGYLAFTRAVSPRLILQWQLYPQCAPPETRDAEVWARASTRQMDAVTVRALDPADQLIHTCLRGLAVRPNTSFQRLSDVMFILSGTYAQIDWDSLLERAQKADLILPMREMLRACRQAVNAPVPDAFLDALDALPVSAPAQREHAIRYSPARRARAQRVWYAYMRRNGEANALRRAIHFPLFLRDWFGAESLLEMSRRGLGRLIS